MQIEEFSQELKENMKKININITDLQTQKFFKYMNLLIEWNQKINLTAIIEPKDIIIKHFVDCGTLLKYLNSNEKVIDVGTGAGFPGIPLKILDESINITLVDSLNKRVNFLNEVISNLNLNNINVIHSRAEDLARNMEYREQFDKVVSRAVANLTTLSEYDLPFVKVKGKFLGMKSLEIEEEIEDAKKAIRILGGKIEKVDRFKLIDSDIGRSIVIISKENKTPKQYPRKAGKPLKEPLE